MPGLRCALSALLLASCADAAGSRAPADAITSDDVAVIHAALRSHRPDANILLLDRATEAGLWEAESLPRGAEKDFNRRNRRPVVIPDSIGGVLQVSLVVHDTMTGMPDGPYAWHSSVSMPGYSTDGRFAVVTTGTSCGSLCGSATGLVLERMGNGWRIQRYFGTMLF